MPDRLVTVRSYYDPIAAELAMNLLQSEGVLAFLADSKFVTNTWHLANAVQGIKLQVREEDADKARYLLDEVDMARSDRLAESEELQPMISDSHDEEPDEEEFADTDDDDDYDESEYAHVLPASGGYRVIGTGGDDDFDEEIDEEAPPNPTEATAERAFKGAAFGLIFLPLQFYVVFLLADVFFAGLPMRPRYRRKAIIAAVINVTFLILLTAYLRYG